MMYFFHCGSELAKLSGQGSDVFGYQSQLAAGKSSVYLAAAGLAAKTKSCNCIATTRRSGAASGGKRQRHDLAALTCRLLN